MTLRKPVPDDDWTPPAGTTKRLCPQCKRWHASRGNEVCFICQPRVSKPPGASP